MNVTQSTMKKHVSDGSSGKNFDTTYYGFADYDGSTTHVAIVRYENSVEVYQLDPECLFEALDQLTRFLVFKQYDEQWLDVAVHRHEPSQHCNSISQAIFNVW